MGWMRSRGMGKTTVERWSPPSSMACLRTGRLAELLPETTELDLNPVIASERGCLIVDARILLRPAVPNDPLLPGLRT